METLLFRDEDLTRDSRSFQRNARTSRVAVYVSLERLASEEKHISWRVSRTIRKRSASHGPSQHAPHSENAARSRRRRRRWRRRVWWRKRIKAAQEACCFISAIAIRPSPGPIASCATRRDGTIFVLWLRAHVCPGIVDGDSSNRRRRWIIHGSSGRFPGTRAHVPTSTDSSNFTTCDGFSRSEMVDRHPNENVPDF